MAKLWHDTGKQIVEVPVFADGGWSDVEQIEIDCTDELPAPSEPDDLPDWQDVPELWAQDYPGIDYDAEDNRDDVHMESCTCPECRETRAFYPLPSELLA